MADQRIKINIGTSYKGDGVNHAKGGLDGLSKSASAASKQMGMVGRVTSKIGGLFGGLPGPIGSAIRGVEGLTQAFSMLKSGMGGVVTAGAALLAWMIKKQKAYEEARKAAIALRKAEREARIAAEIAADNKEEKRLQEKAKAAEEYAKKLKEITKANWRLYESEKQRQTVGNSLKLTRLQNQNKLDAANETDPLKRQEIEARGNLKEVQFVGQQNIKLAKQALAEEMAKLQGMQSKVGTESDPIKAREITRDIEAQLKRVQTARTKVEIAQDNAETQKALAEIAIKDIQAQIVQAAEAAAEAAAAEMAARQAKQEEEDARKNQFDLAWKEIDARTLEMEANKDELAKIDDQVKRATRTLEKIEDNQRTLDRGVNVNNGEGNGINGANRYGNYDWGKNQDANGTLNAAGAARAARMATGQDRNDASRREGANISQRRAERYAELQDRLDRKGKLDAREQRELDNLKRWGDQAERDPAKERLQALQEKRKELADGIQQALKDITVKVQDVTGLK